MVSEEESNSKAGNDAKANRPKCWSCRWYCVKHCLAGLKGYPDIGVVCPAYSYEPGNDQYEY